MALTPAQKEGLRSAYVTLVEQNPLSPGARRAVVEHVLGGTDGLWWLADEVPDAARLLQARLRDLALDEQTFVAAIKDGRPGSLAQAAGGRYGACVDLVSFGTLADIMRRGSA